MDLYDANECVVCTIFNEISDDGDDDDDGDVDLRCCGIYSI